MKRISWAIGDIRFISPKNSLGFFQLGAVDKVLI